MIIDNRKPGQQSNSFQNNNFENKWNQINENNNTTANGRNMFVKNIKDQKYANASNTSGMQDKTLAMLEERLKNNLISLDEFNKKCAQLAANRQNSQKNNKLF